MLQYLGLAASGVQEEISEALDVDAVTGAVTGQMRRQDQIVADIIAGIRHSVSVHWLSTPKQELLPEDFLESSSVEYSMPYHDGTWGTYKFRDYCPQVFGNIRKMCGVTFQDFLKSWCLPKTAALEESTARSGSMFYKTPDKKYFFKTMLGPEVDTLLDLLKDYHGHLTRHPNSFLVRIYGMMRISIGPWKCFLQIMGNAFPSGVALDGGVYDLKGRKPKPGKSLDERGVVSQGAIKDNEINFRLLFCEASKNYFIDQIHFDVELLKSHDIMDYSLLLGLHTVTAEEKEHAAKVFALRDSGRHSAEEYPGVLATDKTIYEIGGLISLHLGGKKQVLVFLSIIDNLTKFTFTKQMANWLKW